MPPPVDIGTDVPDDRGCVLWIVSVVGVALSALFVGARLAQRYFNSRFELDDFMIVASLVACGLLAMCEGEAVEHGYGRRWDSLEPHTRIKARQWFYGGQILYKAVLTLTKVAVVCLYYRVFAVASVRFRMTCHIVNGFIIMSGMAFILAGIFQCRPIAFFWNRSLKGKCFKEEPWWISWSAIQVSTDVILLALPLGQIISLRITKLEKAGLCFVFATGLFTTFATIFRATSIAQSADHDLTWGPIPATVWSLVEANAGIICACLPMLRHPFLQLFGPLAWGVRKLSTSTQNPTYHLTSLINHRSATNSGSKHGFHAAFIERARDSVSSIGTGGGTSGGQQLPGQGTNITVRSEVIISRNSENGEVRTGNDLESQVSEREGTMSREEATSGKNTHLHV